MRQARLKKHTNVGQAIDRHYALDHPRLSQCIFLEGIDLIVTKSLQKLATTEAQKLIGTLKKLGLKEGNFEGWTIDKWDHHSEIGTWKWLDFNFTASVYIGNYLNKPTFWAGLHAYDRDSIDTLFRTQIQSFPNQKTSELTNTDWKDGQFTSESILKAEDALIFEYWGKRPVEWWLGYYTDLSAGAAMRSARIFKSMRELKFANAGFNAKVAASASLTEAQRKQRIAEAKKKPVARIVPTVVYLRNEDIVAQKLFEASGVCQKCEKDAPFNRKSDGSPYLEVHHIKPLSAGGDDSLDNTIALCPSCHRRFHYGVFEDL